MPTKEDFDNLSPADFMDQVEAENAARRYADDPCDQWDGDVLAQRQRRSHRLYAAIGIAAAVGIFLLAWCSAPAEAHDSWISHGNYKSPADNSHCCGDNDCRIVEERDITISSAGYTIESLGETIPYAEAQQSEDRDYWRCKRYDGSRRCFFAPQPAS